MVCFLGVVKPAYIEGAIVCHRYQLCVFQVFQDFEKHGNKKSLINLHTITECW